MSVDAVTELVKQLDSADVGTAGEVIAKLGHEGNTALRPLRTDD